MNALMKRTRMTGGKRGFSGFALFVVLAGVGVAGWGGYAIWKARRLQTKGVTVQAKVLDRQIVREGDKGSARTVYKLLVSFKVRGGKDRRELVNVSKEVFKKVDPSKSSVKITYDPDDPKSLTYGTGKKMSYATGIFVIVIGVLMAGIACFFLFD